MMTKPSDKYEPKLYPEEQTRFALTPAMERILMRDHLCFHEEIGTKIEGSDITRILYGYLRYQRDKDVYALEDTVTEAFDIPRKRGGGDYRFRFNRELTDLICSFDFSREENFNKRVLAETLLQSYCSLPYAEREKIFFYDSYLTIQACISEHTMLDVRVRTVPGEIRSFSYKPCVMQTDDHSLLCYLAGYSRDIGTKSKYSIYSVRLQRIVSAINTKQSFSLNDTQQEKIRRRIEEFGIAYINWECGEQIRVALTEYGYQMYLKILLHQRPLTSAPVETKEGSYPYILTFNCSQYQIMNYFFPFGAEAEILEPLELREEFAEKFRNAVEVYKSEQT